jgi:hypothetical protein
MCTRICDINVWGRRILSITSIYHFNLNGNWFFCVCHLLFLLHFGDLLGLYAVEHFFFNVLIKPSFIMLALIKERRGILCFMDYECEYWEGRNVRWGRKKERTLKRVIFWCQKALLEYFKMLIFAEKYIFLNSIFSCSASFCNSNIRCYGECSEQQNHRANKKSRVAYFCETACLPSAVHKLLKSLEFG